jgi:hypothetical protein
MAKDQELYRVVSVPSGSWWPRNRKSLGSWLGVSWNKRDFRNGYYRIERAIDVTWLDVTDEFRG